MINMIFLCLDDWHTKFCSKLKRYKKLNDVRGELRTVTSAKIAFFLIAAI